LRQISRPFAGVLRKDPSPLFKYAKRKSKGTKTNKTEIKTGWFCHKPSSIALPLTRCSQKNK
jgi:hypothetical protein